MQLGGSCSKIEQIIKTEVLFHLSLRARNTGLVSSMVSLTSLGKGAFSALVDHASSDGVTIKIT